MPIQPKDCRQGTDQGKIGATHPFAMNVDIVAFHVVHELLCGAAFDEGYAGVSVVCPKKDIKNSTSTDHSKEIPVGGTVGQILGND